MIIIPISVFLAGMVYLIGGVLSEIAMFWRW